MNKIIPLLALAFIFLAVPLVSADTFEQGELMDIRHTVTSNGSLSGVNAVNITVKDPDKNVLVAFQEMTFNTEGSQEWNYTLASNQTEELGQYCYTIYAFTDSGDVAQGFCNEITTTGQLFDAGDGLVSVGMLLGVLILSGIFMFLGFRLSDRSTALGLFFVIISMVLGIYSLQLGLSASHAILQLDAITNMQSAVYVSILWLVTGIGIISMFLMLIGFLREFGKGRMMKNFGEGFDPITQTYQ